MKHTILTAFLVSIFIWGCTEHTPKSKDAPISDLGHIDVILDSVTWYAIKNDSFIQNEFGV
ncbi:MAG: hypothetical protein KF741_14600, partial [Ferruginibacter sp.]|nr:hypothetical protein [Ferruginibacter sp.]